MKSCSMMLFASAGVLAMAFTASLAGAQSTGTLAQVSGTINVGSLEKTFAAPTLPATAPVAVPIPVPAIAPANVAITVPPAAPAIVTETALSKPSLVPAAKISAGDTAWMLIATALVLLMTIPGLALFYGGMVRKKNALGTMAQTFVSVCLVTILWVVIGYSLAFTPGTPLLGGFDRFLLHGMSFFKDDGKLTVSHIAPAIPESVFVMYQMTFAIITPALITGAFAERMKFSALILFISLWSLVVYAPVAHWVWEPTGWLATRGVLDFAGGTVVHINAGISGLVAAVVVGRRIGYGKEPMPPHNLVLTIIGASLLWVGWFGFNAGSALAADGRAGMAMLTTQIAAATAALAWMSAEWIRRGAPSMLGLASGAVAGLVAITPASGYVGVDGALVIGAVAGVCCYLGCSSLKAMLGYDDSLDVFGVHAIGGAIGALLTGIFAVKEIGGATSSLEIQALGVIVTSVYAGVMTVVILWVVDKLLCLQVTPQQERDGLDISQHGETVE